MIKQINSKSQSIGSAIPYVAPVQPDEIANLEFWFKSGVGTDTEVEGADVTTWADQSGNDRALTAPSGRKTTYNAATGANGYPGITFDGSSSTMATGTWTALTNVHIFMVVEILAWGNNDYVIRGSSTSIEAALILQGTTPDARMYSGSNGPLLDDTLTDGTGQAHLIEALYKDASSTGIVDDNVAVTGNPGATEMTELQLGASNAAGGHANIIITEIFGYSAEITATDLDNIRAYINGRYGIATN